MKLESSLINTFHRVKARAVPFNKAKDFHGERKHTAGMLRTFWSFDTLVFQTLAKRIHVIPPTPCFTKTAEKPERSIWDDWQDAGR